MRREDFRAADGHFEAARDRRHVRSPRAGVSRLPTVHLQALGSLVAGALITQQRELEPGPHECRGVLAHNMTWRWSVRVRVRHRKLCSYSTVSVRVAGEEFSVDEEVSGVMGRIAIGWTQNSRKTRIYKSAQHRLRRLAGL